MDKRLGKSLKKETGKDWWGGGRFKGTVDNGNKR